ncbi:hypothetical protein ES703_106466 [subsurface metagenome]
MENIIGITNLRQNLTKILNGINEGAKPCIITSHSKPKAIIINFKIYSLIEEHIENILLVGNPKVVKEIEQSRKDYAEGKVKTFEEIFTE